MPAFSKSVKLEIEKLQTGETWHEDIQKLAVIDKNNVTLGYIYCDFYQRFN